MAKPKEPKEPDYGEHLFELRHPHGVPAKDDVSERMAEGALRQMTGEYDGDFEESDRVTPADVGGPFVESSAFEEYAYGSDGIPADAEVAALPRVLGDEPPAPDEEIDGSE